MGNIFNINSNRRRGSANNDITFTEEEINNRNMILQNNTVSESLALPRMDSEQAHNQNSIVVEHQKTKKTKSYKNPIILFKSSLKLEKNAIDKNIYYITFKYTSLLNFNAIFHFNANAVGNKMNSNEKFPSIKISNIAKGNEEIFFFKDAFINSHEYYFTKKDYVISEKGYYDVIIELEALKEVKDESCQSEESAKSIECILATFCNLLPYTNNYNNSEKHNENSLPNFSLKIKSETQKLKVKNYWFEMHNIFGLDNAADTSSNDCEACCVKKKNTIFLPCKHSYACSDCSMVVRLPNNVCPLCRQVVTDCLILDENK